MSNILCRQCGHSSPRENFPNNEFRCPCCDWYEILRPAGGRHSAVGAGLTVGEKRKRRAAADDEGGEEEGVVMVHDEEPPRAEGGDADGDRDARATAAPPPDGTDEMGLAEVMLDLDLDRMRELSPDEFTRWCGALFEKLGFTVVVRDAGGDGDCDLELAKYGTATLVDCGVAGPDEEISRSDGQRLVGAMIGRRASRGILMTTGSFSEGCRAYIETLTDVTVDLIDGAELRRTIEALTNSPLLRWLA